MSAPAKQAILRLAVTGIGMASSLGDAVTACAAARAGLVRPGPLPLSSGMDGEEPAVLSGHPCAEVQGFEGFARLCYLALLALEDLLTDWSPGDASPSRIAVLINLPTSDERPLLLAHLVRAGSSTPGAREGDVFAAMLRPILPGPLRGAALHFVHGGHAGVAEALLLAEALLDDRQAEHCVVGGVDSALEVPTLEWLDATGKLKTPELPTGLMPGEGTAFVALERTSRLHERQQPPLALLGPLSLGEEDADESPAPGEVLARTLRDVLEALHRRASLRARVRGGLTTPARLQLGRGCTGRTHRQGPSPFGQSCPRESSPARLAPRRPEGVDCPVWRWTPCPSIPV